MELSAKSDGERDQPINTDSLESQDTAPTVRESSSPGSIGTGSNDKVPVPPPREERKANPRSSTKESKQRSEVALNRSRIGTQGLTHDKVAEIKEAFELIDQDEDGVISQAELRTILRSLGLNPTDGELSIMMKEADINEDGAIKFDEFLKLMIRTPEQRVDPRVCSNSILFGDSSQNTSSVMGESESSLSGGNVNYGASCVFENALPDTVLGTLSTIFEEEDPENTGWIKKAYFVDLMTTRGDMLSHSEMEELLSSGVLKEEGREPNRKICYRGFLELLCGGMDAIA